MSQLEGHQIDSLEKALNELNAVLLELNEREGAEVVLDLGYGSTSVSSYTVKAKSD